MFTHFDRMIKPAGLLLEVVISPRKRIEAIWPEIMGSRCNYRSSRRVKSGAVAVAQGSKSYLKPIKSKKRSTRSNEGVEWLIK